MTLTRTENARACAALALPARPDGTGDHADFSLTLRLDAGYAQVVDFGVPGLGPLVVDEPEPLGAGIGPNPARVLGAALGACLGASLLFCLRRAHVDVSGLRTSVDG